MDQAASKAPESSCFQILSSLSLCSWHHIVIMVIKVITVIMVLAGVETVDCEGLNTVIPGKTKLPLSHQVHIIINFEFWHFIPERCSIRLIFTLWHQMCRKCSRVLRMTSQLRLDAWLMIFLYHLSVTRHAQKKSLITFEYRQSSRHFHTTYNLFCVFSLCHQKLAARIIWFLIFRWSYSPIPIISS